MIIFNCKWLQLESASILLCPVVPFFQKIHQSSSNDKFIIFMTCTHFFHNCIFNGLSFHFVTGKVTCNVQSNGRVTIKGVVTHGRTITRGSPKTRQLLLYEMKIRKSCPPGPFTVSFNLPGPVDPRLFGVNFAWGLLEGIAIKK